jgi:hypothetical protein
VPKHKHIAIDSLSRRPRIESDDIDNALETDIKDFIDAELGALSIAPVRVEEPVCEKVSVLEDSYSEDSQRIAKYLTTLRKPENMRGSEFRNFKKRALRYAVMDKQLYLAGSKNIPSRLVVDSEEKKAGILKELYDESGHKGRESIYQKVVDRYY